MSGNWLATEGKGSWIPDGWGLPIFVISLVTVVVITAVARRRQKRR
ncbi:hypothetical protein [Streptomyces longispororuber]|nr:hypothetical protein [Streptomyces longispororuber]